MNTTLPDTDKYPGLIVRFSVPLLVAAIISILSPAAFSQQVAGEASENEEAGDDVVELSPFVIDAKSET